VIPSSYIAPSGSYSPPTGSYGLPVRIQSPSIISSDGISSSFHPSQNVGSFNLSPFQQTFQQEGPLNRPLTIGSIESVRSPASFVPVGQFASRPSGIFPSSIQSGESLSISM